MSSERLTSNNVHEPFAIRSPIAGLMKTIRTPTRCAVMDVSKESSPQGPDVAKPETPIVRVMTWNIHSGRPVFGRRNLERIVDFARRQNPGIVALQEVGSRRDPTAETDFAFLADALGNHATETRLITAPDGHYGHAVISRWPIVNTRYHDISYRWREPRAAIETTAQTPFGPLHVIAAHLGLSFSERRYQTELLADLVRSGPKPSVLIGDLNDWFGRGSVQATLNALFPGHSQLSTYPAFCPVFALDRIYCRPRTMLLKTWTDREARTASDHLPVIAELAMKEE